MMMLSILMTTPTLIIGCLLIWIIPDLFLDLDLQKPTFFACQTNRLHTLLIIIYVHKKYYHIMWRWRTAMTIHVVFLSVSDIILLLHCCRSAKTTFSISDRE